MHDVHVYTLVHVLVPNHQQGSDLLSDHHLSQCVHTGQLGMISLHTGREGEREGERERERERGREREREDMNSMKYCSNRPLLTFLIGVIHCI